MQIIVKLFSIVREKAGASQIVLDLPEGATVASAAQATAHRYPAIESVLAKTALAVNCQYAAADQILHEGDEVALIPPVSGGRP